MGKILLAEKKTSKDGKEYFKLAIEGLDKPVIAFGGPFKQLDEFTQEVELSKDGESYFVKRAGGGGGGYRSAPRDNEIIIAQVAYKGVIDLMVAGQLPTLTKDGALRSDLVKDFGLEMAQAIQAIYAAIKPAAKTE